MQLTTETVLYEELELYSASSNSRAVPDLFPHRQALEHFDQGALLVAPDCSAVAVLDATATCLTLFHTRSEESASGADVKRQPRADLAPCVAVRSFKPTYIGADSLAQSDVISAACWSADSSRLGLACGSGHVYILDKTAQPLAMLPATSRPWSGKSLAALALPTPCLALLLTARPPQLIITPLPAQPPHPRAAPPPLPPGPRPTSLAKQHGAIRTAVYDARTSTLVVAGDAPGGSGAFGVSAWRVELPDGGPASAAAVKVALLGSYTGPISTSAAAAPASSWPRYRWTLAVSPLGEHVCLTAPPSPPPSSAGGGGLLLLALPDCRRVDPEERFAGRSAPPPSALRASLVRSAASATSTAWWRSETALALADATGGVGLAGLPGYDNLLAGDEQPRFAPGTLVGCLTASEPGRPRGLLVLEPRPMVPGGSGLSASGGGLVGGGGGSGADKEGEVAGSGWGGRRSAAGGPAAGGTAAAAGAAPPGQRLVLLAERTPQQMLQILMRDQRWGAALELCAAAGLPSDTVYRARWASRRVDGANIADNLAKVQDRLWVVAECCQRLAGDYEDQRALINYGLRETAKLAKPPATEEGGGPADDTSSVASAASAAATSLPSTAPLSSLTPALRRSRAVLWIARLVLWRHSDRLEVLYAAQGRTFDPAAYAAFRDLPLPAAAGSWAALGAVGPLALLVRHYPTALSGTTLLGALARLPAALNPRLYGALLPQAEAKGDAPPPLRPPAMRKTDWVEQPATLAELRQVLAENTGRDPDAVSGSNCTDSTGDVHLPLPPDVDPLVTDAVAAALAPPPRLSAAAVAEWYGNRALELDEQSGQLQGALALLDLGWERGARSGRLVELMAAAKALMGLVFGGSEGASWQLGLGEFVALPPVRQLRLLLAGVEPEGLEEELRERVIPFVRRPGSDPAPLLEELLETEMAARPDWTAKLVAVAAAGCTASGTSPQLFGGVGELARAVRRAVLGCPHTDHWGALEVAVDAAIAAVKAAAAAGTADSTATEPGDTDVCLTSLSELHGWVRGGALLAARGLLLTVRHVSSCGREEAARAVRQVLGRVQRRRAPLPPSGWSALWSDLAALRAAAWPHLLPGPQLLGEVARCMLHCGATELAGEYLRGGAAGPDGDVITLDDPADADALIASAAAELLAGATDPWDTTAQRAADCLTRASPDSPPAMALQRLLTALQMLPDLGLEDVPPALVMQMSDKFQVMRMVMEQGQGDASAGDSATASMESGGAVAVTCMGSGSFGRGKTSSLRVAAAAMLGGRFSRRRAAMRAAGVAAAAGGRAAAALAGGLLAVAGRVAPYDAAVRAVVPVAGMVADAVAGAVTTAAVAASVSAAAVGDGMAVPPYRQVGRLLQLAELLGLHAPEDELRVKELAGRTALRCGDVETARQLAGGLLAARYVPAWSLCADLGSHKALRDDAIRQKFLSYALLHCPPERMTRLLEELRDAERRADGATDPRVDAPEYLLRQALLAPDSSSSSHGGNDPTSYAVLPSLGDVPLALAVLSPATYGSKEDGGFGSLDSMGSTSSTGRTAREGGAGGGQMVMMQRMLRELRSSGGGKDEGSSGGRHLSYSQLQRVLMMECYCHCLAVLLPRAIATEGTGGSERMELLHRPLKELLERVRPLAPKEAPVSGLAVTPVAAALAAAGRMAAAHDSRAVRQHVPEVDAALFGEGGGGEGYRRQAILQLASLAGAAEAGADTSPEIASSASTVTSSTSAAVPSADGTRRQRSSELLAEARRLAAVYDTDPWDIELAFMSAMITSAPVVTPELRSAIQSREAPLLRRPLALLAHLATSTLTALPHASGPHLALALAVTTDCLHACAKADHTATALAASAAPILDKLRELLDKAGPALKGLALVPLHTPLLTALLAPLLPPSTSVPSHGDRPSFVQPVATAAAAAAIFSYVKPSNLPQAAKLLAALHKLMGPLAKKPAPLATGAAATGPPRLLLVPELQAVLDALPPSLPYLYLCVKAIAAKVPLTAASESHSGPHARSAAHPPHRDIHAAWGHIEEVVGGGRLPAGQLAAWLGFLMLPGCGCPIDPRVSGGPLQPCSCPWELSATILDVCMPKLIAAPPCTTTSTPAAAAVAVSPVTAPDVVDAAVLRRLRGLHVRLRVLRAAQQYAAEGLSAAQLSDLETALLRENPPTSAAAPALTGARTDDTTRGSGGGSHVVHSALSTLAAAGCPVGVLLDIATAAAATDTDTENNSQTMTHNSTTTSTAATELVAAVLREAVSGALQRILLDAADAGTAGPGGTAVLPDSYGGGMLALRGVLRSLDTPTPAAGGSGGGSASAKEPPASAAAAAASSVAPTSVDPEVLSGLRDVVWRALSVFVDGEGGEGERGVQEEGAGVGVGTGGSDLSALEALRPAAAAELLELQGELGTRVMWSGWRGAGAGGPTQRLHRLRLLAARTRTLLTPLTITNNNNTTIGPYATAAAAGENSAMKGAMSDIGSVVGGVGPEDVGSATAASRLFGRLLAAVVAGGAGTGGDGGGGGSPALCDSLRLLGRLLSEVWHDGEMWDEQQQEAGYEGERGVSGSVNETKEGTAPAAGVGDGVSQLHGSWAALAVEMLRAAQVLEVVRLLDPPTRRSSGLLPLDAQDVQELIGTAASAATAAALGVDVSDAVAMSHCLGLASPYESHRQHALEELLAAAATQPSSLRVLQPPPTTTTSADAVAECCRTLTAVLLLSCLVRSGKAVRLAAGAPSGAGLLAALVRRVPASIQDAAVAMRPLTSQLPLDSRPAGCVLPYLAASLAERRDAANGGDSGTGLAAALVARRLRLHPALAAANGSRMVLERYLTAAAAASGEGDEEAARGWPGAVAELWRGQREACRRAVRSLAADR